MIVSCPVCDKECNQNVKKCEKCGFTDRLGIAVPWLELAEAEDWMDTVVLPYRRYWEQERKSQKQFKLIKALTTKLEKLEEKVMRQEETVLLDAPEKEEKLQTSLDDSKQKEKSQHKSMVLIPGGSFMMGSPVNESGRQGDESPQHEVTISQFYMGRYPVTQAEYLEIMGENPSNFKGQDLPVESVSWYDAVEYCNRLSQKEGFTPAYEIKGENVSWNRDATGYRLPTEAEWEYACRAGTTTPYNTGNTITTEQANYSGKMFFNRDKTTAVGSFQANPWGLYDMHGNVWEWCWDWYGNYSSAAQTDPVGASSGTFRVLRGGGWIYNAQNLRSAARSREQPV